MIIRGAAEENAFIAMDNTGRRLGRSQVEVSLSDQLTPERPLQIKVSVTGSNDARPALLGAATTRAMMIAREHPEMPARVYTQCGVNNRVMLDMLEPFGFVDDDALVRMRRAGIGGGSTMPVPAGCLMLRDALDDATERRFFLERLEKLFCVPDPETWLNDAAQRPGFERLLMTTRDGLAGEVICYEGEEKTRTGQAPCGVIALVYTAPAWRRRGVASCLMETARVDMAARGLKAMAFETREKMAAVMRLGYSVGYKPAQTLYRLPGIDL